MILNLCLKYLVVSWRTVCEVRWWRPQAYPWPLVRLVPLVPLLPDLWGRSFSQRPSLYQPQVCTQPVSFWMSLPQRPILLVEALSLTQYCRDAKKGIPLHFQNDSLAFMWFMKLTTSWLPAKYNWAETAGPGQTWVLTIWLETKMLYNWLLYLKKKENRVWMEISNKNYSFVKSFAFLSNTFTFTTK